MRAFLGPSRAPLGGRRAPQALLVATRPARDPFRDVEAMHPVALVAEDALPGGSRGA